MLYFNTNVGATLAPHQPRQSEQVCPTQRTLHLGHERGRASQHGGVAPEADLPETAGLPAGGSGAISAVNRRIPIATPLLTSSLGGPDACPLLFFQKTTTFLQILPILVVAESVEKASLWCAEGGLGLQLPLLVPLQHVCRSQRGGRRPDDAAAEPGPAGSLRPGSAANQNRKTLRMERR